jgi:hypothetical protein
MGSFSPLFNLFSTILFSRPILFLTSVIKNHLINFRKSVVFLRGLRRMENYLLNDYEREGGSSFPPLEGD